MLFYTIVTAMPKYGLEDTVEDTKPKLACMGLRDDLRDCLLKSDCVKKVIFASFSKLALCTNLDM